MARKSTLPEASGGDGRSGTTDAATTSRRAALKLAGLAAAGTTLAGATAAGVAAGSSQTQADDPTQVARLTAADGANDDAFGRAIDCNADGERVIVGAPTAPESTVDPGAGTAYVFEDEGGDWTQTATLDPDDGTEGQFGTAVAFDDAGTTAIVGAPQTDQGAPDTGAAYVFTYDGDGWTQVVRFDAGDLEFADGYGTGGSVGRFGGSCALDAGGETALIGAPISNRPIAPSSGAAYAFQIDDEGNWTQVSEFLFPGGDSTWGGAAVALDADGVRSVAGMPNNFPGRTGHVLVFDTDDEGPTGTELIASDESELNLLGASVATDDDGGLIVGGAPGSTPDDPRAGRLHAFTLENDQWNETAEILPDDGQIEDGCGEACALSGAGDRLLAGAPAHDAAVGDDAGAAHVFEDGDDWAQTAMLQPDDGGQAGAAFGDACALDAAGSTAFVGASGEDTDDGENAGAVYVFDLGEADDDAIQVPIDVGPGRGRRPINPRSRGLVPIVLRATDDFAPSDETTGVDVDTIRFGAPDVVDDGGGAAVRGDGVALCEDLFVRVPTQDTGFDADSTVGKLVAETHDGRRVVGETEVRIVGPGARE